MRQAECISDSIYKSRCLKRLRELELPTEGWVCEWIEDTNEPEAVCELCGCARVRFLHHMSHPMVGHTIAVGCLCDGIMSSDELGAYEREREARNRAKRRQTLSTGQGQPGGNLLTALGGRRKCVAARPASSDRTPTGSMPGGTVDAGVTAAAARR